MCEGGLVAAESLTAVMDCPDSGRDRDNLATLGDTESRVFISCTKSFTFLKWESELKINFNDVLVMKMQQFLKAEYITRTNAVETVEGLTMIPSEGKRRI